jgi:hypothetical protein
MGDLAVRKLTLEDTATYLLGPIMGFVLLLRGCISLHASTIAIRGLAVVLIGPAGSGKSTTAAAFAGRGYSILAQDVMTLDDQGNSFLVRPAYPCIRLWPSSVAALYGPQAKVLRLTPTWDKCYLDLTQKRYRFNKDPLPLAAIYVLDDRLEDPSFPSVRDLSPAQALISLIENTYLNYLMDREMLATKFELLGRVLANVPIRQIIPHSDPAYISKLCTTLIEDFEGLNQPKLEKLRLEQTLNV